ncbi:MAG: pilin [Candidatus Saccharimonadales bacterium]
MRLAKRLIAAALSLGLFLGLAFGAAPAALAFYINQPAPTSKNVVCSTKQTSATSYCADTKKNGSNQIYGPGGVILKAANVIAILGGIIAVIMIIVGAIMFAASGGDSKTVETGKNMIVYSLIGIVVIALAYVIVRFVIGRL